MKQTLALIVLLVSSHALPATMNFSGSFRSSAEYYKTLDLGARARTSDKSFLSARALLNPSLIVDDHFQIQSQWMLFQSPETTPHCSALGNGQGAAILGDVNSASFALCRAWFEWSSDFGLLKLGRMPFSWGYGLMWDDGSANWDDFQTTLDRLEYRLYLGNIVGGLAYSKARKLSVLGADNDQEFYTAFLQYNNQETEVEGGILYEKQSRSVSQSEGLSRGNVAGQAAPSSNPYAMQPSANPQPFLAQHAPHPLSAGILDVYLKKTVGSWSFGAELNWQSGTATYLSAIGTKPSRDNLNALGITGNVTYQYHAFKTFLEFLYASGDSDLTNNQNTAFVLLHRNRRPGLILGRELLGPWHGNSAAMGSPVVYGVDNSFSGVYYFRPGARYEWSSSWASGIEFVIAQKAAHRAGESADLGVEIDIGTDYSPYKKLELGVAAGFLFPGKGLGYANPKGPFALRSSLVLQF